MYRARRRGEREVISSPSRRMEPESGVQRPRMFLKSVVLPEPLRPSRIPISPRASVRSTPLSTGVPRRP